MKSLILGLGFLCLAAVSVQGQGCCESINLDSLGMSHFEQDTRVGDYEYYKTELSGKFTYKQVGGNSFLYYIPNDGLWMVGEELYVNFGGILNRNFNDCPEDFITTWEYWYDFFGEWKEDGDLEAECINDGGGPGGPGTGTDAPPGETEQCTSGTICLGCDQTTTIEGILFCCETNCDYGWISGGSSNGVPYCECGHD